MDEVRIRDRDLVGRVKFDDLGPQERIEGTAGHIPQRWELAITVERSTVTIAYRVHGGATVPGLLTIDPPSKSVLRTVTTRMDRWTELCERALVTTEQVTVSKPTAGPLAGFTLVGSGGPVFTPEDEGRHLDAAAIALHNRRLVTDEELMEAAAAYYEAPRKQKHTAVMEALDCSASRANLLIRRARKRGLIEDTGQGRAAK